MALPKIYNYLEHQWHNNTTPSINEDELNAISYGLSKVDDRVIDITGTLMEDVPAIQQYLEQADDLVDELEALTSNPPYIGSNGNWYTWDTNTGAYVDSGVDASITITVGTTSTLPAGSSATVTNSGTNTDPVLNFGIPKGETGATGATGATPSITANATVDANVGTPSVTVTKSGTDAQPVLSFAFSNLKGETGQTGQTGQTGATGADGYSPVVTITTITGGHTVTITDRTHQSPGQSFNVMDGTDGTGDMDTSAYDPQGTVATAGGIVAYVTAQINAAVTSALTASY